MLTLIFLIGVSAILIAVAALAMVNDWSPAELAEGVARFLRHCSKLRARLPRE